MFCCTTHIIIGLPDCTNWGETYKMIVLCNGMVRGGSSVQYNVARLIVELTGKGKGEGYFKLKSRNFITGLLLRDKILDFKSPNIIKWLHDDQYHVIKIHGINPDYYEETKYDNTKILYIHRNIMDVASSFKRIYQQQNWFWRRLQPDLIASLDWIYGNKGEMLNIPGVFAQKYEEAISDKTKMVYDIAKHININITSLVVKKVIQGINEAAEMTRKKTPWYQLYDPTTLMLNKHVGGGECYLTDEEIKRINNRYIDRPKTGINNDKTTHIDRHYRGDDCCIDNQND